MNWHPGQDVQVVLCMHRFMKPSLCPAPPPQKNHMTLTTGLIWQNERERGASHSRQASSLSVTHNASIVAQLPHRSHTVSALYWRASPSELLRLHLTHRVFFRPTFSSARHDPMGELAHQRRWVNRYCMWGFWVRLKLSHCFLCGENILATLPPRRNIH